MRAVVPKGTSAMSKGGAASAAQAQARLRRYLAKLESVPLGEVERTATQIKAKAIAQAPYKTGKLEDSIEVEVTGSGTRLTISATASATSPSGYDYAGIQHDDTSFNHPIKGKAKYLSDPFNEEIRNMQARIRRKLRKPNGS